MGACDRSGRVRPRCSIVNTVADAREEGRHLALRCRPSGVQLYFGIPSTPLPWEQIRYSCHAGCPATTSSVAPCLTSGKRRAAYKHPRNSRPRSRRWRARWLLSRLCPLDSPPSPVAVTSRRFRYILYVPARSASMRATGCLGLRYRQAVEIAGQTVCCRNRDHALRASRPRRASHAPGHARRGPVFPYSMNIASPNEKKR